MSAEEQGVFHVRSVAVIGAGPAGRAFAFRCASAGLQVVLEDVMPSNLRRAQDEYAEFIATAGATGSLRYAGTVEDAVHDADLVIDFVPDELESKLEIFSLLDRMAPPRTIFCTPTKTLSITDLASCTYRGDRCVGVQAESGISFVDDDSIRLIRGKLSSDETIETAAAVWLRMGKRIEVVTEAAVPGFGG